MNTVTYDSYYLTKIETSSGTQVNFVYQNRPDAGGDKRVSEINVMDIGTQPSPVLIKKYQFDYQDISILKQPTIRINGFI